MTVETTKIKALKEKIKLLTSSSTTSEKQKRSNKHQPQEVSSKKPVSRFRQVIEPVQSKRRDPRFDPLCGKFNQDLFSKSYNFVEDYRSSELGDIKRKVAMCKDENEKQKLVIEKNRLESLKEQKKLDVLKKQVKKEWKQDELEAVKKGKKPFYLKKSEQKKRLLVKQFEGMSDKQLEKVIEKKRKKRATKQQTKMPFLRAE